MTHNVSNEDAWADCMASQRAVVRVEDTLDVAHACMDAVVVGFFTGVYTAQETAALGGALLEWADKLHRELAALTKEHDRHVAAVLTSSESPTA